MDRKKRWLLNLSILDKIMKSVWACFGQNRNQERKYEKILPDLLPFCFYPPKFIDQNLQGLNFWKISDNYPHQKKSRTLLNTYSPFSMGTPAMSNFGHPR